MRQSILDALRQALITAGYEFTAEWEVFFQGKPSPRTQKIEVEVEINEILARSNELCHALLDALSGEDFYELPRSWRSTLRYHAANCGSCRMDEGERRGKIHFYSRKGSGNVVVN